MRYDARMRLYKVEHDLIFASALNAPQYKSYFLHQLLKQCAVDHSLCSRQLIMNPILWQLNGFFAIYRKMYSIPTPLFLGWVHTGYDVSE